MTQNQQKPSTLKLIISGAFSLIFGFSLLGMLVGVIFSLVNSDSENLHIFIPMLFFYLVVELYLVYKFRKHLGQRKSYQAQAEQRRALEEELRATQEKVDEEIRKLRESSDFIISSTYLGGIGYPLSEADGAVFALQGSSIKIKTTKNMNQVTLNFSEVTDLEISGPGTVTTNAGISGGGFGIGGFIAGAMTASVLNALTTKSTTNTFFRITTKNGEINFHTSDLNPSELRLKFSGIFVVIKNKSERNVDSQSISSELSNLHKLFQDGVMTQEEFNTAKARILN